MERGQQKNKGAKVLAEKWREGKREDGKRETKTRSRKEEVKKARNDEGR